MKSILFKKIKCLNKYKNQNLKLKKITKNFKQFRNKYKIKNKKIRQ